MKTILTRHFSDIIRPEAHATPWQTMALCAFATCLPLIAGFCTGHLLISIYGALGGYFLALNDHPGPVAHRLSTITLTAVILMCGFSVGLFLQGQPFWFPIALAAMTFWLGILAGAGDELERGFMFATIAMVVAHATKGISLAILPPLTLFLGLGYLTLMVGIPLLAWLTRQPPSLGITLRQSLEASMLRRRETYSHAGWYAAMALFSIWLGVHFHIERAYWVTVTVMLVMKPAVRQTFHRTAQRFLGTMLGVLASEILIRMSDDPKILIALIMVCAFYIPWGVKRNYWLVSFFVTLMVVMLVELSSAHHDVHTPFIRLWATFLGCCLGLIGTGLTKISDFLRQKRVLRSQLG